jgi:hypothetical protein
VTFPTGFTDLRAELLLAGATAWTDITGAPVTFEGGVVIGRGHPDESTTTTFSSASLTADNRGGPFSQYNPTGQYYGLIGRNTPLRLSTPEGASYLRLEGDQASYASCPDSAGVSITGGLELQADVTLDNWTAAQDLASKWTSSGNQRSWLLDLNEDGTLSFRWSADGTAIVVAQSTVPVPVPPLRRQALRVTLAVASGTVTFYTALAQPHQATLGPVTAGWVQLGSAVVTAATSVFDSTAPVAAGNAPGDTDVAYPGALGKVHSLRLLSGIAGTVKASPDFTAATAGVSSFADAQGNTWTLAGTSEVSNRKYRAHFEVSAWPPSWGPTGQDVTAQLACSGILRRLAQGSSPLNSALYRYWARAVGLGLQAWWPMEDAAGSSQFASGMGGPAMAIVSGSPNFAADASIPGSAPLPPLNNAYVSGVVPNYADTGTYVVRFPLNLANGLANNSILRIDTDGTAGTFYLNYIAGTLTITGIGLAVSLATSTPAMVSIEFTTSGSNVNQALRVMTLNGTITSNTVVATSSVTGRVRGVIASPAADAGTFGAGNTVIGHIAVQSALTALSGVLSPFAAWAGEAAGNRFSRLCGEEGIAFRGQGQLSRSAAMGAQTIATLMALLQECADADRGVMFEPRQILGLGYRTLSSLQNQQPAVIMDYPADQAALPFGLTDDDQQTRNDWTVSRPGGSSARAVQLTGPLNVNRAIDSPPGAGRYDTTTTVNVAADSQLGSLAGWLLHLGTVDEPRYPQISTDLMNTAIDPALLYAAQDADLGDYLQVTGPPAWMPPGTIRQLIQGLSETITEHGWTITWQGVPESAYEVVQVDPGGILSEDDAHFATASSVGTWTTVAASSTLAQTSSPPVPPPVGNAMTVTAAGNATSTQQTAASPCIPRHQYLIPAWFLADIGTGGQACDVSARWIAADGTTLLSSSPLATVTDNPATWTPAAGIATAPNGAYFLQVRTDCLTTATGQKHYLSCITPYDLTWSPPGHLDTDGSALHAPVTATAAAFLTDTSTGQPPWTTAAADFPFDVTAAGERMTACGISATPPNFLAGQNATFEGGIGTWVGSTNCSVAGTSAQAHTGTSSLQVTSAAAGDMTARHCASANITTQGMPCAPGDVIVCKTWLRAAASARTCADGAEFFTAGGVSISTLYGTGAGDVTTGWTPLADAGLVVAPATAAFCRLTAKIQATGAANEVHDVDDAFLGTAGTAASQVFYVVRSVNSVVKAHAAGEDVRLTLPPVMSI